MSVEIIRLEDEGDNDVAIVCDPLTARIIALITGSVTGSGEIRKVCDLVYYSLHNAGLDAPMSGSCVDRPLLLNEGAIMPTEDDCPF